MDKIKLNQINQIKSSWGRERDKLDNILLVLAAGTLSLSATFITQSPRVFVGKKFLFTSWASLIVGLFSILFGYTLAILHFKYFINGIKRDKFKAFDDAEDNWRFKLVEILNWISFVAIVAGIIIFAYFGYLNISNQEA